MLRFELRCFALLQTSMQLLATTSFKLVSNFMEVVARLDLSVGLNLTIMGG